MRAPESHAIDWVPDRDRHGGLADQAIFWFLSNFHFLTIALGFIGPGMGLGLGWTILAGTLGIVTGTVFQAAHASQGAEIGLPQMIQSRAQFGYRGVILPLCAALFTYVGFNVLDTILIAAGMAGMAGWNRVAVAVAANALGAALAVWGYDWLHRAFRWLLWIGLPGMVVLSLAVLLGLHGPPGAPSHAHGFSLVAFATQFTAGATYNLTYATYVSDYARYLPPRTPRLRLIAAVFLGAAGSAVWLVALGAWLATRLGGEDALVDLARAGDLLVPGFGTLLAGVSVVTLAATIGMNTYSGMLTMLTAADCVRPVRRTQSARIGCVVGLTILCTAVSIGWGGDAIATLSDALVAMLYLLAPWTAINLADYFQIRRGRYAVTHLFRADGIYGAWGWRGLVAYGAAFSASLPFYVLPGRYVGPAAGALGGVDVGWIVSLCVAWACYTALNAGFDPGAEALAVSQSETALGAV